MKNLLIISCSKTKNHLNDVPAIDLYDGQAYRVIKKRTPKDIEILIISAKYGLLRSTDVISYYDEVMTVSRALAMRKEVSEAISEFVFGEEFQEIHKIFIYLGFPYNLTISNELMSYLPEYFNLQIASGPIGKRLHQLKEVLK